MKNFIQTLDRYIIATTGMFLSAVGIAMTIVSNLGTSPLSCPSYVLNLRVPSVSVGTFTLLVNCLYVLIQILLLRRQFRLADLLQIVASAIFGYMIDIALSTMGWLHPVRLVDKIGLNVASCLISAFGVSLEVAARAWMLSAEMTAAALAKVLGREFSTMKIAMDCSVVAISAALAMAFFGNPLGDGSSYVIGIGTALSAVLIGLFMRLTDPLVSRLLPSRYQGS